MYMYIYLLNTYMYMGLLLHYIHVCVHVYVYNYMPCTLLYWEAILSTDYLLYCTVYINKTVLLDHWTLNYHQIA